MILMKVIWQFYDEFDFLDSDDESLARVLLRATQVYLQNIYQGGSVEQDQSSI